MDSQDDHQIRDKRPQSPLSPMVNPKGYAPLTQKSKEKPRSFNLEEKFDKLDILGKYEHPTPLPSANRRQSRNKGIFGVNDRVGPTPAGEGNHNDFRKNRVSAGGHGGDDDDDSSSSDDNEDRYPSKKPSGYPKGGPGGDPPGKGTSFPGGNPSPGGSSSNGNGNWGSTGLPPGFPGGDGNGPVGYLGPDGNPGILYIPYPYTRPNSPLLKLPNITKDAYWWDGDTSTLK